MSLQKTEHVLNKLRLEWKKFTDGYSAAVRKKLQAALKKDPNPIEDKECTGVLTD
jgi:hypothetical protein